MSAWPEKRGEIKKMMEMAAKDIEKLGGTVEMVDIGLQKVCKNRMFPVNVWTSSLVMHWFFLAFPMFTVLL